MKKILIFILALVPYSVYAQTKTLVGLTGGDSFTNYSAGVLVGVEVPVGQYEFSVTDRFAPLQYHVGLGAGWSNTFNLGGTRWLSRHYGISASAEQSMYRVTGGIHKISYYGFAGPSFRFSLLDTPNRFTVSYVREFPDRIYNGIESSHLQGASIDWTARLFCSSWSCFRIAESLAVGHVLEQGNPVCDKTACPRRGTVGGSFGASVILEFSHRHDMESF